MGCKVGRPFPSLSIRRMLARHDHLVGAPSGCGRGLRVHVLPPLPESDCSAEGVDKSNEVYATDIFTVDSFCDECLAEAKADASRMADMCVGVNHTAALPTNMFVPLEDDEVPELIDVPHYRCKHMIDEEWEDYALLAYDCSQCPDNHGLDIECGERSHGAGF